MTITTGWELWDYLTRPEFEELANLRKYSFNPACLNFIFRISSEHAGTINDAIQVISCDDVSIRTFIRISIWYYISVVPEQSHRGCDVPRSRGECGVEACLAQVGCIPTKVFQKILASAIWGMEVVCPKSGHFLKLVFQIIQCFSLSHLHTVGPYYFQSLPGAQYQDEFHRTTTTLVFPPWVSIERLSTLMNIVLDLRTKEVVRAHLLTT